MTSLTEDARDDLDRYLRQVRTALRGHRSADPAEVERDVREHVDAELAGAPEPVDLASLRQVLDRLGAPGTWVAAEDRPAWRRVLDRLRSGPEDWRLAYLTFGGFLLGVLLFLAGPVLWPLPLVLLGASVLMARASLALMGEHGEAVGPRRWLLYPPLVLAYVAVAVGLAAWPLPLVGGALTDEPALRDRVAQVFSGSSYLTATSVAGAALGAWLALLGVVLRRFPSIVQAGFWPFADWFDRRHALRLAFVGLFVLTVPAILLFALLRHGAIG
jgi:hypothetical protein